jgi:hypothetical protein
MPKIDDDSWNRGFDWRLRAALDQIKPPFSTPRYRTTKPRPIRARRLIPAVLAFAAMGALSASALAAAGGPTPATLIQRATSAIDSAAHAPETTTPVENPEPSHVPAKAVPVAPSSEMEAPSQSEPSESPEPASKHSPEPAEDHPNTGSSSALPSSPPSHHDD